MNILLIGLIFFTGASLASFAFMVYYRISLNISITKPRSFCDKCNQPIRLFNLIPFFGYFISRGKCFRCKNKIPVLYPITELFYGLLAVLCVSNFDNIYLGIKTFLFIYLISVLSIIDYKYMLVPRVLIYFGIALGCILSIIENINITNNIIGLLTGFSIFYLIYLIKPEGIGLGDAQFSALMGIFLGWKGIIIAIVSGTILGGIISVILLALKIVTKKTRIPMLPFLAIGGIISFFFEKEIIKFYFF